jgi:predicted type IV restriction endonuclease
MFTLELVKPSPLEEAGLQASSSTADSEQQSTEPSKPKRRTKQEIKEETITCIRDGFRKLHPELEGLYNANRCSENDVRHWCMKALETVLGYESSDIKTEVDALGGKIDIALMQGDRVFLFIECKGIKSNLNRNVKNQAAGYATSCQAEWIVLTNARNWKLYRIIPQDGKNPHFIEIFDVALLDEDGVSELDAENLYLLTARAVFGGDLEKMSHLIACTSKKQLFKAMESERVIKALRLEMASMYKEQEGVNVKLDDENIEGVLHDALGQNEF